MGKRMVIGIHQDFTGWHERFLTYSQKYGLSTVAFNMLGDDWLRTARNCNAVMFKTSMHRENIRIFKERVHFLNMYLQVPTFPNYNSFWHFDSKAIQRDILLEFRVRIPDTIVTGSRNDIDRVATEMAEEFIVKDPGGSKSKAVRKVRNTQRVRGHLARWQVDSIWYRRLAGALRLVGLSPHGSPQKIIQSIIPNAGFDLRVVTIGHRYAYIFKRLARPGDFRASGSGVVDYDWDDHYNDIVFECIQLSRSLGFNSMAYDVLVDVDGNWYIGEMSCQYSGQAMIDCPNVFVVGDAPTELEPITVHDPVELQVRAIMEDTSWQDQ